MSTSSDDESEDTSQLDFELLPICQITAECTNIRLVTDHAFGHKRRNGAHSDEQQQEQQQQKQQKQSSSSTTDCPSPTNSTNSSSSRGSRRRRRRRISPVVYQVRHAAANSNDSRMSNNHNNMQQHHNNSTNNKMHCHDPLDKLSDQCQSLRVTCNNLIYSNHHAAVTAASTTTTISTTAANNPFVEGVDCSTKPVRKPIRRMSHDGVSTAVLISQVLNDIDIHTTDNLYDRSSTISTATTGSTSTTSITSRGGTRVVQQQAASLTLKKPVRRLSFDHEDRDTIINDKDASSSSTRVDLSILLDRIEISTEQQKNLTTADDHMDLTVCTV